MSKFIYPVFILIGAFFSREGQAQKLVFDYDAAGNQISREWVCVNCSTTQMMAKTATIADTVEAADLSAFAGDHTNPFEDIRVVSVYPNPVSETLHVRWASDLDIPVKEIYLSSTTGTLLLHRPVAPSQQGMTISFSGYPPGTYWLRAIFKDGRRESITVIKVD